MLDVLPEKLPEPNIPAPQQIAYCIDQSSRYFKIPARVLKAIYKVEGGLNGTITQNTNGTLDLGVMQFNTVNLAAMNQQTLRYISPIEVTYDPCLNIYAATWFLREKIIEAGDLWTGVGNYHSKTRRHHLRYLKQILKAYQSLKLDRPQKEKKHAKTPLHR